MDIRKIKKLIEILENSNMAEIDIKEGEDAIRISRFNNLAPATDALQTSSPVINITPSNNSSIKQEELTESLNDQHSITSPMVGTFYVAPSPNAKPFVSVNQKVKKGDTLCIIEAMKIMNKIEADRAGIVEEILVKDGDAVEFGQPLIKIK